MSHVLDDNLATIIVVTTPRNELPCDTPSSDLGTRKRKHTRTHISVSVGRTPRKQFLVGIGSREESAALINSSQTSKGGHELKSQLPFFIYHKLCCGSEIFVLVSIFSMLSDVTICPKLFCAGRNRGCSCSLFGGLPLLHIFQSCCKLLADAKKD